MMGWQWPFARPARDLVDFLCDNFIGFTWGERNVSCFIEETFKISHFNWRSFTGGNGPIRNWAVTLNLENGQLVPIKLSPK